jgi:hypothetical protein
MPRFLPTRTYATSPRIPVKITSRSQVIRVPVANSSSGFPAISAMPAIQANAKSPRMHTVQKAAAPLDEFEAMMARVALMPGVSGAQKVTFTGIYPAIVNSSDDLRPLLATLDPKTRDTLRRVLIRGQADRYAIASDLLRYRDGRGDNWADIIDMLTMHPDARRRVARVLGEIDATDWSAQGGD